jgi:hypothetical protein
MSEFDCTICKKALDLYTDMPIYHDACGHYACAHSCSDGLSNLCGSCNNPPEKKEKEKEMGNGNKQDVGITIEQQQHKPQKIKIKKDQWGNGFFSWANDVSSTLRNRNETMETCMDPFWLISKHASIELLLEKELHMNALVQAGVTINQFLKADYNIKELAKFPEVTFKKGDTDVFPGGVMVLLALKTRPHHFRDYRDQLPIDKVCELTGLTKRHIVENMRLGFHPKDGIKSEGDVTNKWTIQDLRYLGFTTMGRHQYPRRNTRADKCVGSRCCATTICCCDK